MTTDEYDAWLATLPPERFAAECRRACACALGRRVVPIGDAYHRTHAEARRRGCPEVWSEALRQAREERGRR